MTFRTQLFAYEDCGRGAKTSKIGTMEHGFRNGRLYAKFRSRKMHPWNMGLWLLRRSGAGKTRATVTVALAQLRIDVGVTDR